MSITCRTNILYVVAKVLCSEFMKTFNYISTNTQFLTQKDRQTHKYCN